MGRRPQAHMIVNEPKALTKSWAQNILKSHSNVELKDAKITKVDIITVDVGTTTRIRLAVDHDGPPELPQRWFVKLPSLAKRARLVTALPRLLPTEIRFYNEIARLVPVNVPAVLSAQSRLGKGSTLVLGDVSELGAIAGQAGDALTAEQAARVVEQLASFHLHFINKAHDPALVWMAGSIRRLEDNLGTALAVPLMKRGLRCAGDCIPMRLHAPSLGYARCRKRIMGVLSQGTPTLLHHDCHSGNLFWQDGQPGFLDWQMVRIGEGVSDISYLLATALKPELRRKHELELLTKYHDIMTSHELMAVDFDTLWNRYRAHLVYSFEAMVITLAIGGMMPLESNLEMIRRAAHAVEDHDTFALLANMA